MPHVVLNGRVSLEEFYEAFAPVVERQGPVVHKISDCFLNHDRDLLLLDCLVYDRRPKGFLVMVDHRDGRTSVRLFPPTDPEKCDGVRRIVARVASDLHARFPETEIGATNLEGFLSSGPG